MSNQKKELGYDIWISISKKLDEQIETLDKGDGMSGVMSYGVAAFFWVTVIFISFYTGVDFLETQLNIRNMELPQSVFSLLFVLTIVLSVWVMVRMLSRKNQLKSVPDQYRALVVFLQNLEEQILQSNGAIHKQIKVLNERLEAYFSSNVNAKHELAIIICKRISKMDQLVELFDNAGDKTQISNSLSSIEKEVILLEGDRS